MPTYEYECRDCGATIEIFQSIKAAPLRKARCDQCDATRPVRRLIGTGGAVIFKGSGFYQTDYRSESYKSKAKSESEPSTAPSGDSSAAAPATSPGDAAKPVPQEDAAEKRPAPPATPPANRTAKPRAKPPSSDKPTRAD